MSGFALNLLKERTVVVTGAGKGIGRTIALQAAAHGAKVIAVARTEADLQQMQSQQKNIEIWPMDVNSDVFLTRLNQLERLEGLVNNAGINRVAPMLEQSRDNIHSVIDLNVKSLYAVTQAALKPLLKSRAASIVNVSSQMGFVGSPGRTLYCASKHAVEGLTKALSLELAENNIRVNTLAPTFVLTPMTEPMMQDTDFKQFVYERIPMGRLATQQEVSNACLFLLSDLSSMTTGSCIKVDGGWTAQ